MGEDIFFDIFITFNDDKSEAYVNIRPNSRISKEDLKKSIVEGFKKIKSLLKDSGIVYGILPDKEILEQLKDYCLLPEKERKKDIYKIIIAKGHLPINGEDSELIEHVKLKNELKGKIDEDTGNVDHRNLGFSERIIPSGKLILTLKKPTKGELGMNVLGEPLEPISGEWKHKIKYDKKTIETEEDEKEIRYKSKKEGFLYKDNIKGYFVDEKVLTKAVDFKIGNIEGKEIEDSTVIVQGSSNIAEDSVKANFKVEAKKIKIKGNVGIGALISGDEIDIEGTVDKEAVVEGKIISINKFFGKYVKGNILKLKEISNSKAIGDTIIIENSLSSEIRGKEILVLNESRGSKIISEKFIFINNCQGSVKQEFIIDPFALPDTKNLIEKLKEKLKVLNDKQEEIFEEIEFNKTKLSNCNFKIDLILEKYFKFDPEIKDKQKEILKKLLRRGEYKSIEEKFNVQFDINDIYVIRNYMEAANNYEKSENELKKIKDEIEKIENEINQKSKLNSEAMIFIKNINKPIITIKFKELEYKFTESINEPIVMLIQNDVIKLEKINKETKKIFIEKIEELVSKDIYKILKKVI